MSVNYQFSGVVPASFQGRISTMSRTQESEIIVGNKVSGLKARIQNVVLDIENDAQLQKKAENSPKKKQS